MSSNSAHFAAVHFPISLLIISPILYLFIRREGRGHERIVSRVLAPLGAIAALVAVATGLWLAGLELDRETAFHRNLALAATALALATAGTWERAPRAGLALAVLSAAVVAWAAHQGGELTHGATGTAMAPLSADSWPRDDLVDAELAQRAGSSLPAERMTAIRTLARLHGPAPRALLSVLSKDPEQEVAAAAVAALALYDLDFVSKIQPILEQRCLKCHGPQATRGGLRLTNRSAALKGGRHGPAIVPFDASQSLLVRRIHASGDDQMPPEDPLPNAEAALLVAWVEQGAYFASKTTHRDDVDEGNRKRAAALALWQPLKAQPVPAVTFGTWVKNPIDAFVLEALEKDGFGPRIEADRRTLLRRVTLDLAGRFPTTAELEAFESDPDISAYEKVVDRILKSTDYSIHRANKWLDLARYADSYGYGDDAVRAMRPYVGWVVDAISQDIPYDKFSRLQIAGDLEDNPDKNTIIPTAFLASSMLNLEGGTDPGENHHRHTVDQVNTIGKAFLGLTMECAECHNHKYDPISQLDFYRIYASINDQENETYRDNINVIDSAPSLVLDQSAYAAYADQLGARLVACGVDSFCRKRARADLAPLREAAGLVTVREPGAPRETRIPKLGDFRAPGDVVTGGPPAGLAAPGETPFSRRDLAVWLTSSSNPLFERTAVNRAWAHHFGRGLVATPDDFGTRGSPPSHPALLDWLALQLRALKYSHRELDRLIVTSATYRQRSDIAAPTVVGLPILDDPDNARLGRGPRVRLDAEVVRDATLHAAGLFSSEADARFRSIELLRLRADPVPELSAFGAPDRTLSCVQRDISSSPTQALTLLNAPDYVAAARAIAADLAARAEEPSSRVDHLFEQLLSRRPTSTERDIIVKQVKRMPATADTWFVAVQAVMLLEEYVVRG